MVSYLFLFILFLSSIGLVSSAEGNLPQHLSFENYRSILSFANDDDSKLVGELVGELNTNGSSEKEIWDNLLETDGWNVAERNEEKAKMKTTTTTAEADSSSSHFPFILCHVAKSSLCGQERHDVIDSLLSKGNDKNSDSSCGYFLNPLPIYNKNNNLRKGKIDVKEDNNRALFYGSCFYSSIQFSCASQIDDEDILVTPVVPLLKIRKHFYHTTEDEQSIDETTRSLAVILSPGIFSSHDKISEFAYLLQNLQSMDGGSSLLSDCDENVFKGSSISVDSAGMTSYFFLEFQSQVSRRCIRLFMEYVVEHPQVLSIEKVAKTVAFNYEAQWITQSSIPEEKPWFEIGLTGKNQIVQVADTGVDLDHCYLKEIDGESVMHTTVSYI